MQHANCWVISILNNTKNLPPPPKKITCICEETYNSPNRYNTVLLFSNLKKKSDLNSMQTYLLEQNLE